MKLKKLFSAMLAILMITIPVLTGCSKADNGDKITSTTTAPEAPQVDPKDAKYDSITIGGVNLSEFSIVYAPDAFETAKKNYRHSFTTGETHYAKLIAEELAAVLESMTGVTLPVIADTEAESAHEILIGNTSRSQSGIALSGLSTYSYKLSMMDGKLCIGGGSSAASYHALDALYSYFAKQNSKTVVISEDYNKRDNADLITVACVGDSITEGYLSSNNQYCSWPAVLQRILWKDYVIVNYGNSGKTMRDDLADAYSKTGTYTTLMREVRNADITLIMLGTNDSNRDQNWNDNSTKQFNESCQKLVSAIEKKRPGMTYFIMDCPVYSGNGNFGSATVRDLQRKLVTSLADEGYDMHYFDMYTYSKDVITLRNFGDGLHPSDKGYVKMAEGVRSLLEQYRERQNAAE